MHDAAHTDVRVFDLAHCIVGPYSTGILADYGDDVIKVERADGGDPARRYGPFPHDEFHPEKRALLLHLTTNRRGLTLHLRTAAGTNLFKALTREVDSRRHSWDSIMRRSRWKHGTDGADL